MQINSGCFCFLMQRCVFFCFILNIIACIENGITYTDGAEFLAADGCNECECDGGVVRCENEPCFATGVISKLVPLFEKYAVVTRQCCYGLCCSF